MAGKVFLFILLLGLFFTFTSRKIAPIRFSDSEMMFSVFFFIFCFGLWFLSNFIH